jgi:ABC-2 type transport system permease protein
MSAAVPSGAPGANVPASGAAHGSTAAAMRGAHWGPLRREVVKLLFQRRSYVIWGGAALIPFIIALAIDLANSGPEPGEGPQFLSRVLGNGMYVPLAALAALLPFLLPMAAAMVAGYMLAGEAELGTLRIILLRPVKRGSIVLTKWLAAMLYLLVGFVLMVASGLLFGGVFFGLHPMVLLSGTTIGIWHGLGLIALACLYGLAAMGCIVSLALLFSALTDSSLTALIAAIVVYIVIGVLTAFSYFDWLKPWVFPTYFENYLDFFRDPIYWTPILKGLAAFAAWSGGLVALTWALFRRKDVLS